jgi:hypothetical protein
MLAVATTWPLVLHLTRSLPVDQGDSLLNCWILSWNADHLLAWFWGNTAAFQDYWSPPIFHPAPLALAYSEHLFAEALQIAPIYGLTHNVFLCYNLLVLSTYVLSALGMYLLARELTSDARAAWVAGACYGFALVRLPQLTHLQVLSSQWMPFVLYGLRRYFTTLRADPLGWAAVALVMQNLSCGYYLVFFAPAVVLYCLYEIADRALWWRWRMWVGLAVAATAVALATWPFLKPYLWLRALGFPPRPIWEVQLFSADVLAPLTASPGNRVWGWLQTYRHAEGELFPGVVTLLLAGVAVVVAVRGLRVSSAPLRDSPWRRLATALVLVACAVEIAAALLVGATSDPNWRIGGIHFRLGDPWKAWVPAAALAGGALVLSRRLRAVARGVPGSALGFFAALAIGGSVLALGPIVSIAGQPTELPAPYAQLYWHVPGYDGLRVPARFATVVALGLAGMAGFGAHALTRRGLTGRRVLTALSVLFVLESTGAPIGLDRVLQSPGWGIPRTVGLGDDTPDVYRVVSTLPVGTSLLELPFGIPAWDVQYVFYEQAHHRPIVNGFSGGSPSWYWPMTEALDGIGSNPALAWSALERSGASHVIVHRRGYLASRAADRVETFLSGHGARMIRASGDDRVYALPRP